jgi:hypothetical protein
MKTPRTGRRRPLPSRGLETVRAARFVWRLMSYSLVMTMSKPAPPGLAHSAPSTRKLPLTRGQQKEAPIDPGRKRPAIGVSSVESRSSRSDGSAHH